ncbi:hypothetical protein K443DRAFT_679196 [Laccaria amethystina LaAM-08-1]|uniref:Uncharacterized protein n=1 Tax=Laccaria amethystina LaAM-08-1 TaxID=1095629 RepID=A0A0C9XFJ4_9AGAR|nr:hypothetical protein K443DRAFT_679196 [Laccaria amethystina LaAM-08-1]
MVIPLFSTNRLGGSAVRKRLRRRSQLTAINSNREHLGRDVDGQPGSSSSYESSPWLGAPNFNNISWLSVSITAYGKQMEAIPFGYGGGPTTLIPADQPFAGRESGGGTRAEVYGNSYYGSGYPGRQDRGVDGRGFPFVFWPVVFTAPAIGGGASYLYREVEYGGTDNSTRPGFALQQSAFSTSNCTFRLISDTTTTTYLYYAITRGCALSVNGLLSSLPTTYNSTSSYGRPEQAVQYYRASSVVLTLDGYNNTAALNDTDPVGPPAPLPSTIDVDLLKCINATIGASVPLVGSSGHAHGHPTLILLTWLIFFCYFM